MEPTLEDISDYDTLKGDKKKTVWTVIIVGILLGIGYLIAYNTFTDSGDALHVQDPIKTVPLSKNIALH
jgi:hypothetical protein